MNLRTGTVRPDGTSSLIQDGIYDMASAPHEVLSPELEERLQKALAAFDPRETQARFKLEVFFQGGPRRNVAVRGVIACWTNGGYLNGGGDASVYLCPQELGPEQVCMAPLDLQFVAGGHVVCTRCRRVSKTDSLIGQIVNEVPLTRWAEILVRLFHVLECSADLRICVERGSLRLATGLETLKNRGGEEYAAVAAKREWMTYPLANIIKDTASGSGLEQRFRAFLEA